MQQKFGSIQGLAGSLNSTPLTPRSIWVQHCLRIRKQTNKTAQTTHKFFFREKILTKIKTKLIAGLANAKFPHSENFLEIQHTKIILYIKWLFLLNGYPNLQSHLADGGRGGINSQYYGRRKGNLIEVTHQNTTVR